MITPVPTGHLKKAKEREIEREEKWKRKRMIVSVPEKVVPEDWGAVI